MPEILSFAPAIVARVERECHGVMACRTVRAAHGRHELHLRQSRHLVAMQLSTSPITSSDRLDGRSLPLRTRAVASRINIVPAGVDWTSRTEAQSRSEYVAVFIPDAFLDALAHGPSLRRALRPTLDAALPRVQRVMQALAEDLREPVFGDLCLDGAVRLLLAELARAHGDDADAGPPRAVLSPAQMRRLDEAIEAHLHRTLTVGELARQVGVGERALAAATRQAFGMGPCRLVLERRIDRARDLLWHTDAPLAEVGARCGFDDQAHFTTAFRQRAGITPGRYRRGRR